MIRNLITAALPKPSNSPLTEREKKDLGKANMWLMDWVCDGLGKLPDEIQKISDKNGKLTPAESRVFLAWYHSTAPGNY